MHYITGFMDACGQRSSSRYTYLRQQIESMKNYLHEMYGLYNRAEILLNGVASHIQRQSVFYSNVHDDDVETPRPQRANVNPESTPERLRHYANRLHEICSSTPQNGGSMMYLASPRDPFVSTPKYHLPEDEVEPQASYPTQSNVIQAYYLIEQLASESEGYLGEFKQTIGADSVEMDLFEAYLHTYMANDYLRYSAAPTVSLSSRLESRATAAKSACESTTTSVYNMQRSGLNLDDAENQIKMQHSGSGAHFTRKSANTVGSGIFHALKSLEPGKFDSYHFQSHINETLKPDYKPERLTYEMKQRIKAANKTTQEVYKRGTNDARPQETRLARSAKAVRDVQQYEPPSPYRLSRIFSDTGARIAPSAYGQHTVLESRKLKNSLRPRMTTKAEGALVQARALSRYNDRKYDLNLNEWHSNLRDWRREQQNDMAQYRKYK